MFTPTPQRGSLEIQSAKSANPRLVSGFKVTKRDTATKARLGVLKTRHGVVKTPSYVIVATHAAVKTLKPSDIKKTKTQIVIANTYHLWDQANNSKTNVPFYYDRNRMAHRKNSFLINKIGVKIPTMTDSGGFQVLSLAFGKRNKAGKFFSDSKKNAAEFKRVNIKITNKGVAFTYKGKREFLDPKISMDLQKKIGADIIFAFDEATSPYDNHTYNEKALKRTHKWARESLKYRDPDQVLFGIVQGGIYKDLRIKSAKYIGSLPFDGFGIGGSYTKKQISKILKWIIPYLPEEKPRHLLGVGKVEDIFEAIENGIDLFDCVIPTREARHGRIYSLSGYYDIRKGIYANNKRKFDQNCGCPACKVTTRSKLHMLFRGSPNQKVQAQRSATLHNVWFFNNLIEKIRQSIVQNRYNQFKIKFLATYQYPLY